MAVHHGRRLVRRLGPVLIVLAVALATTALAGAATRHVSAAPDFGPNVKIFDPGMSATAIKSAVDAIAAQQVPNQFGTERYALLFMPGTYGSATAPLNFQVGYYTEVAGLGSSPNDVAVNGTIDSYNQCFGPGDCTALVNFWRSMSPGRTTAVSSGSSGRRRRPHRCGASTSTATQR
jgi:hypothetical protein